MRKLLFILLATLAVSVNAQKSEFGIQAGLNYNFSGDLTEIGVAADDLIHGADSKTGFHGGIWYKLNYADMFLKGELLYTQFENSFSNTPEYTLTTKKIDIPIVLGMKVFGPIYVFAGPDFQYILDEDFSLSNTHVTYDDFTMGLHIGVGVEFKRISFDVRWDKGLSGSDSSFVNSDFIANNATLDNRPNQLVFSLNYSLTGDKE